MDPTGWGGADDVGGSPPARGSALPPADVEKIVVAALASKGASWDHRGGIPYSARSASTGRSMTAQ